MKLLRVLVLLLLSAGAAAAQAPAFFGREMLVPFGGRYLVTGQFVPLYSIAGDTASVVLHANQGEALAVRAVGPTWAQVQKNFAVYYVRKQYLNVPLPFGPVPDSVAVPRDPATGLVRYAGEAAAPGTRAELMGRAQVWFATAFRAKNVLQVQDPASGTLVGKAVSDVFINATDQEPPHQLEYTIEISCRNGGYRYHVSSFSFSNTGGVVVVGTYGSPSTQIGTAGSAPAERFVFATRTNGTQRALTLQYKAELYRVAREVQGQLRAAMRKPVGS